MASAAVNRLVTQTSGTDATSYAATVVPGAADRVLVALVLSTFSATPVEPTLSGTNGVAGTWTNRGTIAIGSVRRLTVFTSVAASTVSGVLTASFGAETQIGGIIEVLEFTSGVTSEVPLQVKTNSGTGATSLTITFDNAFGGPFNPTLACFGSATATAQDFAHPGTMLPIRTAVSAQADAGLFRTMFTPLNLAAPASTCAANDIGGIALEFAHDDSDVGEGGGGVPRILTGSEVL